MATFPSLKTENIDAYYDTEQHILMVAYRGLLSPEVTKGFYQWLMSVMQDFPNLIYEARGSIFDFRAVRDFQSSNITTARRESQSVTRSTEEIRNHPVALLVETTLQERMVEATMRVTEQVDRKRIVHSLEEARDFIVTWQKAHAKEQP